jgi:hypothetical protein
VVPESQKATQLCDALRTGQYSLPPSWLSRPLPRARWKSGFSCSVGVGTGLLAVEQGANPGECETGRVRPSVRLFVPVLSEPREVLTAGARLDRSTVPIAWELGVCKGACRDLEIAGNKHQADSGWSIANLTNKAQFQNALLQQARLQVIQRQNFPYLVLFLELAK